MQEPLGPCSRAERAAQSTQQHGMHAGILCVQLGALCFWAQGKLQHCRLAFYSPNWNNTTFNHPPNNQNHFDSGGTKHHSIRRSGVPVWLSHCTLQNRQPGRSRYYPLMHEQKQRHYDACIFKKQSTNAAWWQSM